MAERLTGSGVNAPAFIRFVDKCRENGITIHSLRYSRNGSLVVGADFAPYSGSEVMQIYSLSKTFTSAAVGIAIDEGILDLNERMCDIFPDKMPAEMSDNLKKMRLCDVLSMQSGHPRCVFDNVIHSGDSLKTFFESEVVYEPGTKFIYSTAGTMVCGAAVTRRSGESLVDYLTKRLFTPLGIAAPSWDKTDDGICHGGIGLRLNSDSILKLGELLLNRGVYNGKRIISAEYIDDATASHSIDVTNGSPDWISGYGYQIWLNNKNTGGYRGDGAFGQLCIVLPEKREVFVILCECSNMQTELDVVIDFMNECSEADSTNIEKAKQLVETEYMPRPTKPLEGRIDYDCEPNPSHIFSISLVPEGKSLVAELNTDFGKQRIVCGNGEYIHSASVSLSLIPSILQLHNYNKLEDFKVYGSYEVSDGTVTLTLRHSDLPHTEKWTFTDDELSVSVSCGGVVTQSYRLNRKN